MKKNFLFIVLIVLSVLGAIFFLTRFVLHAGITVPKKADIYLTSSIDGNVRVPGLVISVFPVGICNAQDPSLITEHSFYGDTMYVDIVGYRLPYESNKSACYARGHSSISVIKINLDWLKQDDNGREIVVRLNGKENKYNLTYKNYRVILKDIQAVNINNRLSSSEIILNPIDVAIIYLSLDPRQNSQDALRSFAQKNEFTPAEEVYPGFPQEAKYMLYVVPPQNYTIPKNHSSESLGRLSEMDERIVHIIDTKFF